MTLTKIVSLVALSAAMSLTVACSSSPKEEVAATEPVIEQTASETPAVEAAPAQQNMNLGSSSSGLGH